MGVARDQTAALETGRNLKDFDRFDPMAHWAFHQFSPPSMKSPQPVRIEYRLTGDGDNLSTVLHALRSEETPQCEQIFDLLKCIDPAVEKLTTPIVGDGQTSVAIKEKGMPAPVGASGLSDGTMFSLALGTAIFSKEIPSLIGLETPDTELHPYAMEIIAETPVTASEQTQIIVTTHSPFLLN